MAGVPALAVDPARARRGRAARASASASARARRGGPTTPPSPLLRPPPPRPSCPSDLPISERPRARGPYDREAWPTAPVPSHMPMYRGTLYLIAYGTRGAVPRCALRPARLPGCPAACPTVRGPYVPRRPLPIVPPQASTRGRARRHIGIGSRGLRRLPPGRGPWTRGPSPNAATYRDRPGPWPSSPHPPGPRACTPTV